MSQFLTPIFEAIGIVSRGAHGMTVNATSRCGNVLQVFESDSKIYDIIARIYKKDDHAVLQMLAYCFGNEVVFNDVL